MTTKTLKSPSSSQLLTKVRKLHKDIKSGEAKIRRQVLECWESTYLYFEAVATRTSKKNSEIASHLADVIPDSTDADWLRYRKHGEFLRNNKIDREEAAPSCISMLSHRSIPKKDLAPVIVAINAGEGPAHIRRLLCDSGHVPMRSVPRWRMKEVRTHKKRITDWKPELAALRDGVQCMKAKYVNVQVAIIVNGQATVIV